MTARDKLPKGWVKTSLGEVCLPVGNIRPEDSFDEFTYFDIGGIDNQQNCIAETKTIAGRDAPSRARQALRKDDVLFSNVRTYLRNIARVDVEYPNPVASTGFTVIRAAEGVSSQFLFFQVLSEQFVQPLNALQSGSSYPAVRSRDVFDQPILLPPTHEQERIAAKLVAAFSSLQRAERASRRAQERLEHYRTAVLDAALSGELTRSWRETRPANDKNDTETAQESLQHLLATRRARWREAELQAIGTTPRKTTSEEPTINYAEPAALAIPYPSELPAGWVWASLDQLLLHITDGDHQPPPQTKSGVPFLVIGNISQGHLDFTNTRFVSKAYAKRVNTFRKPVRGDILYSLVGSFGMAIRVDTDREFCVQRHLAILRPHQLSPVDYIYFALNSSQVLQQAAEVATGTTQKTVPLAGLRRFAIPLPPADEQHEIVRELDQRLSAADRLAIKLERQFIHSRATRDSLLREAFSGRFVSQDPTEEPASVLLQRIRTAREAEAQKPKGKDMKRSISRSKIERRPLVDVLREQKRPITPEQLFRAAGFEPSQVDLFYRELTSLRDQLREQKPKGSEARSWPHNAHVFLQLKKGARK